MEYFVLQVTDNSHPTHATVLSTTEICLILFSDRPGFRVDQISDRANNNLSMLPNTLLTNGGTNDVAQDYDNDSID